MAVIMRASVHLTAGARLYYDCPMMGGDNFKADAFFKKYRGKTATFVSYCEDLVGPLDRYGRLPGRYIRGSGVNVRFDGEDEVRDGLNIQHFIVHDLEHASLAKSFDEGDRLGDLPFTIDFYPGDLVMYREKPEAEETGPHRVIVMQEFAILSPSRGAVVHTHEGKPQYRIEETDVDYAARVAAFETQEKAKPKRDSDDVGALFSGISESMRAHDRKFWSVPADQLRLVSRGNVYALYFNQPLSFGSKDEEFSFWAQEGISQEHGDTIYPGVSFERAWKLFSSGKADLITIHSLERQQMEFAAKAGKEKKPEVFAARRLNGCFRQHAGRVHELTELRYAKMVRKLQKA